MDISLSDWLYTVAYAIDILQIFHRHFTNALLIAKSRPVLHRRMFSVQYTKHAVCFLGMCYGNNIVLCISGIKDSVYERAEGEFINGIFNVTSA